MDEKEYIEREAVLNAISALPIRITPIEENRDMFYHDSGWNGASVGARVEVGKIPAADVVEVVRCKDCRCWEEDGIDPITNYRCGFCRHYQWQDAEGWDRETNGNDFCSYGERKE